MVATVVYSLLMLGMLFLLVPCRALVRRLARHISHALTLMEMPLASTRLHSTQELSTVIYMKVVSVGLSGPQRSSLLAVIFPSSFVSSYNLGWVVDWLVASLSNSIAYSYSCRLFRRQTVYSSPTRAARTTLFSIFSVLVYQASLRPLPVPAFSLLAPCTPTSHFYQTRNILPLFQKRLEVMRNLVLCRLWGRASL